MKKKFDIQEFSKKIVAFVLINGTLMMWCSYVLAWYGRDEIAESLSQTVAAEEIGVILAYSLKALFENISKNNSWPDKKANSAEKDSEKGESSI